VIISSGYRIGPDEIEESLTTHEAVADAGVIGVPDEMRGEIPKAFVVLGADHEPAAELEAALQAHVKERLTKYEYPRELEFIAELPKTTTGKIRRHDLREREELISAGGLMIDMMSDFVAYQKGGFLAEGPTRLPAYFATRPLFEQIVRRRVTDLDRVDVRHGHRYVNYLADDATTVAGITVRNGDSEQEELPAELVVDATGRTSRTPTWLDDHGYVAPDVEEGRIDVAYSTVVIERPADDRLAVPIGVEFAGTFVSCR